MDVKLRGRRIPEADAFEFEVTIKHHYIADRRSIEASPITNADEFLTQRFIEEFGKIWAEMTDFQIERIERVMD